MGKSHTIYLAFLYAFGVGLVCLCVNRPVFGVALADGAGHVRSLPVGAAVAPMRGVAYGPFQTGQSPEQGIYPTLSQVQADMPLLNAIATEVRSFGCVHLETVITATAEARLPLLQGVWVSGDATASQADLACAVNAAAAHPHIQSLGVGNETILSGSLTVPQLCAYLAAAKAQSGLPVTTAETWPVWLAHPELVECVDYVSINLYAYWDGVAVEDAVDYTAQRLAEVSAIASGKPIVLSEIGWPSAGAVVGAAVPGVAEQAAFAAAFLAWARPNNISWYWFEGMDEPWKCENGRATAECHWGLYASDRTPKPAQKAFASSAVWLPVIVNQPTATPTLTPSPEPTVTPTATPRPPAPSCTITQPLSNTTVTTDGKCSIKISGTVQGATAGSTFDFAVHTDKWYGQAATVSAPQPSGSWQASPIYLGGQGSYNNHTILAQLQNNSGAVVATCQVSGVIRGNACLARGGATASHEGVRTKQSSLLSY